MASARDVKRRIRTVKNIEKITSAMKMVAAARLRKAQERAEAARPYAEKMHEVMGNLARSAGEIEHPLLEVREERNVAYVVIGAERGLAGSYNGNVMNKAVHEIGKRDPEEVKLLLVGRKAVAFFRKRPYQITASMEMGTGVTFTDIRKITTKVRSLFESGEVDAVYLIYAKFYSAMRQEPVSVRLLPMAAPEANAETPADFMFEPNAGELLATLLPKYVDTEVYQSLVESQASEHGARMSAMSAATKNAGEMIDNLTLVYNKARQAAITKEITEIVGGAEALK
ncbi:MAG: ATP synthase F1 subunit gamma [Armatimonadota bacterium]|nr:ATP synthase F1 subunit gamma [bacterium]